MGYTPQDIGEYICAVAAAPISTGSTAGTAVNGYTIDRLALGSPYKSVQIVVPFSYIKTTAGTISVNAHLQDSPTSTAFTDFGSTVQSAGAGVYSVAATTAGSTSHGQFRRNVDITTADRYIRVRLTPQMTVDSSVAILKYGAVLIFGGADEDSATTA